MGLKQRSFAPKDSAEPHLSKGALDKRLAAQLGVRRWERVREAGERVALASAQVAGDLGLEHLARPAVLDRLMRVSAAGSSLLTARAARVRAAAIRVFSSVRKSV
jgi:hypothetical protein